MLSRDNFQFILQPWEHRGAQFDPRPDFVVDWCDAQKSRIFLLKAKRNLLFFRDAYKSDKFLCALEAPLCVDVPTDDELRHWMQNNRELVIGFWQQEIQSGNYGRCILGEHPHAMGSFLLFFMRNGKGWLRESWDAKAIQFDWKPKSQLGLPLLDWPVDSFPRVWDVIESDRKLQSQIEARVMPDDAIEEQPLEWLCGSHEELERLTRLIALTESREWPFDAKRTFLYGCESQEGRAMLHAVYEDDLLYEKSSRLTELTDLALDYNTPVGLRWVFCDGSSGSPPIRGSWQPEEPVIQFVIECPTQHERLEAYHELREWLRGKVPESDLEAWLTPAD